MHWIWIGCRHWSWQIHLFWVMEYFYISIPLALQYATLKNTYCICYTCWSHTCIWICMHMCMYLAIVMRHAELIAERIVFGRSSTSISHFYNQYNVLPVTASSGTQCVKVIVCLMKPVMGEALHWLKKWLIGVLDRPKTFLSTYVCSYCNCSMHTVDALCIA